MKPLAPAVFELRVVGVAFLAAGVVLAAVAGGVAADPRAGALGLVASVVLLWCAWGGRAVRRAIRLALPVRPRWRLETTGATVVRVLAAQVLPLVALAVAGAIVAHDRFAGSWAAAGGFVLGAGACALLAAQRVRRADLARGRRLLHEPRWGAPLGRRAFHLEPTSLSERPGGTAATPWPGHRPAARAQRSVVELDPVNGAATHAVGVRGIPRTPARLPPDDAA